MFAKIFLFFSRNKTVSFRKIAIFFLTFTLCPVVYGDTVVLKNGQKIRADRVRMKNGGNLVEIVTGNKVETIPFSRIESILPDFPAKKSKTDSVAKTPKVSETPKVSVSEKAKTTKVAEIAKVSETPKTTQVQVAETAQVPETVKNTKVEDVPKVSETANTPNVEENSSAVALKNYDVIANKPVKKSRWRLLQALVPFWSPLLLSDRGSQQLLGGLMVFTKLFILYDGQTYFQKPRPYLHLGSSDSSPEGVRDFYTLMPVATANGGSGGGALLLYFGYRASEQVISSKGDRMEEDLFYERRRNYAYLLLTAITLDIFLSNADLSSGDLKSVNVSTSDGGRTNSLSFTWVF